MKQDPEKVGVFLILFISKIVLMFCKIIWKYCLYFSKMISIQLRIILTSNNKIYRCTLFNYYDSHQWTLLYMIWINILRIILLKFTKKITDFNRIIKNIDELERLILNLTNNSNI